MTRDCNLQLLDFICSFILSKFSWIIVSDILILCSCKVCCVLKTLDTITSCYNSSKIPLLFLCLLLVTLLLRSFSLHFWKESSIIIIIVIFIMVIIVVLFTVIFVIFINSHCKDLSFCLYFHCRSQLFCHFPVIFPRVAIAVIFGVTWYIHYIADCHILVF